MEENEDWLHEHDVSKQERFASIYFAQNHAMCATKLWLYGGADDEQKMYAIIPECCKLPPPKLPVLKRTNSWYHISQEK